MTTVTAVMRRPSFSYAMFDNITDGARIAGMPTRAGQVWTIVFDAELTAAQVQAVMDRMSSTDDTDQAERARIAAALDGGATNLAQMLAERELGRPVREPIYPE